MSTSRRAFLRGAATLPIAAATGGSSAAAARTAQVAGGLAAGGFAALGMAEKISKINEYLGRNGGFPQKIIKEMMWGGGADKVENWQAIFTSGAIQRPEEGQSIDVNKHARLLAHIKGLPRDIPLMDLLSDEMIETQSLGHEVTASIATNDIRKLRNMLEPYCNEHTTTTDITNTMVGYFEKLARHALEYPDDFRIQCSTGSGSGGNNDAYVIHSGLRQISHILRDFKGAEVKEDPLYTALKDQCENWEEGHKAVTIEKLRHEARQELVKLETRTQQRREEFERSMQAKKENQKKARDNTAERAPHRVDLIAVGEGLFLIRQKLQAEVLPAREDWRRWQEGLTGQETKPDEIEVSMRGLAVKFNNEAVLERLKQSVGNTKGWATAVLPNDRMGVDLNQPASNCFIGRDL